MKKYHDNNKSYNAIVEAMQQIRYNALVEEYGEDEMEEAYMYEAEGEEEEAVAQMMDEALYEMDMEDDEDNQNELNEADGDQRKARRRKRLRQALLIGAGLAATGGLGYAASTGRFGAETARVTNNMLQRGTNAFDAVARGVGGTAANISQAATNVKRGFDQRSLQRQYDKAAAAQLKANPSAYDDPGYLHLPRGSYVGDYGVSQFAKRQGK